MGFEFSKHVREMLDERGISEEWVWEAIKSPEWSETGDDGNVHYFKSVAAHGGRILHVVVNPDSKPGKMRDCLP